MRDRERAKRARAVVLGTARTPTQLFDLMKNSAPATAGGHGYGAAGLPDAEIWNLVRFAREGTMDLRSTVGAMNRFTGDAARGRTLYMGGLVNRTSCQTCHGADGLMAPSAARMGFSEFVGKIAAENPWEFVHKVRFGQPGVQHAAVPRRVDARPQRPRGVLPDAAHRRRTPVNPRRLTTLRCMRRDAPNSEICERSVRSS